ncbi:MAG: DNA polymerase I [Patescibacteria group bacterium]
MDSKKDKMIIVDGNALVHRAFHALPPTMQTKSGLMTNAAYGFVSILFKVVKELKPKYGVVTFDLAKKTFRHEQYAEYKATRKKQPDELYAQFPIVKEIVKAFNMPIYEMVGFEADDLIGTITKKIDGQIEKYIVTGDMDTLQLVDDETKVFTLKKSIKDTVIFDADAVREKYHGLGPEQMIDYKALRGDPSDNIPGIRGIGEKGAIELLNEFKTLENIFLHIKDIKSSLQTKLINGKQDAKLSKSLATILRDIPIKISLSDCEFKNYNQQKVIDVLQKYEFKNLLMQLQGVEQLKPQASLFEKIENTAKRISDTDLHYHYIDNKTKLNDFLKLLAEQKIFALDTETDSLNFMNAKLLGMSISWNAGQAYYIDFIAEKELLNTKLRQILSNDKYQKIGHNIKYDWHVLNNQGVELSGIIGDSMIASYLLNPGTRQHSLDKLAFSEFGHTTMSYEDLCGKGKQQIPLIEVDKKQLNYYACEDADYTWQLYKKIMPELTTYNQTELYNKIEIPLVYVLKTMERNGVMIDAEFLSIMEKSVSKKIKTLEKNIFKQAGQEFNISSPLQLKEILFEKLNISTLSIKKIKTGLSTAAAELTKLRQEHEIIPLIEQYRELTKLQSTYIQALPKLINQRTKRVHASFNQTITATGRLSSSDPNLQNIPIRTDLGKEIRKAFVAPKNYKILTVDYSQIELRIIASLANDEKMIASFKNNEDIHARTAAEINNIDIKDVSKTQRRAAKSINFGIIYGMGSYGLSQDAGISKFEAQEFIDRYFKIYHKIKDFLENTKASARVKGYVETLFGRRRNISEINSSIFQVRQAAERMAINMPVQGTAADVMKLAMIEIQQRIDRQEIPAKMVLQVHDELVFEVHKDQAQKVGEQIKEIMETVYKISCPIVANINIGDNWEEAK